MGMAISSSRSNGSEVTCALDECLCCGERLPAVAEQVGVEQDPGHSLVGSPLDPAPSTGVGAGSGGHAGPRRTFVAHSQHAGAVLVRLLVNRVWTGVRVPYAPQLKTY